MSDRRARLQRLYERGFIDKPKPDSDDEDDTPRERVVVKKVGSKEKQKSKKPKRDPTPPPPEPEMEPEEQVDDELWDDDDDDGHVDGNYDWRDRRVQPVERLDNDQVKRTLRRAKRKLTEDHPAERFAAKIIKSRSFGQELAYDDDGMVKNEPNYYKSRYRVNAKGNDVKLVRDAAFKAHLLTDLEAAKRRYNNPYRNAIEAYAKAKKIPLTSQYRIREVDGKKVREIITEGAYAKLRKMGKEAAREELKKHGYRPASERSEAEIRRLKNEALDRAQERKDETWRAHLNGPMPTEWTQRRHVVMGDVSRSMQDQRPKRENFGSIEDYREAMSVFGKAVAAEVNRRMDRYPKPTPEEQKRQRAIKYREWNDSFRNIYGVSADLAALKLMKQLRIPRTMFVMKKIVEYVRSLPLTAAQRQKGTGRRITTDIIRKVYALNAAGKILLKQQIARSNRRVESGALTLEEQKAKRAKVKRMIERGTLVKGTHFKYVLTKNGTQSVRLLAAGQKLVGKPPY